MKKIINLKGFTLIELMVVISIIAIVAGIIISSSIAIQRSGRDAVRVSDLATVQSALEHYHADYGYYPYDIDFGADLAQDGRVYLEDIPDDPNSDGSYYYTGYRKDTNGNYEVCDITSSENCLDFCIYATLENEPGTLQSDKGPCSLADPSKPENYFVTSP